MIYSAIITAQSEPFGRRRGISFENQDRPPLSARRVWKQPSGERRSSAHGPWSAVGCREPPAAIRDSSSVLLHGAAPAPGRTDGLRCACGRGRGTAATHRAVGAHADGSEIAICRQLCILSHPIAGSGAPAWFPLSCCLSSPPRCRLLSPRLSGRRRKQKDVTPAGPS